MDSRVEEQFKRLERGTAEIISREDLKAKIARSLSDGKPLRIKLGLDPTAPHIHLGFAVVLRKLRQFQDLGHRVILLIGDFTARVGDPTGRSVTRKVLTTEEILENAKTYREQFSRILDPERTEVRFNSEWLDPMTFADVVGLTGKYTVARIMERDDFSRRFKENIAIGLHEILYPLMQGYDSVALESDVEMGGTDQKFNILVGRELQREYGQEPQVVFLMPILEGIDGVQKMSKSLGNYVGITEPATEMFMKLMRVPDELVRRYFELCTDVPMDDVDARLGTENPRDSKRWMAREIIALYHPREAADAADAEWLRVVSQGDVPTDMPEVELPDAVAFEDEVDIVAAVQFALGAATSKRDARRLVDQGAVLLDGAKVSVGRYPIPKAGCVLKAGKTWRRIFRAGTR